LVPGAVREPADWEREYSDNPRVQTRCQAGNAKRGSARSCISGETGSASWLAGQGRGANEIAVPAQVRADNQSRPGSSCEGCTLQASNARSGKAGR